MSVSIAICGGNCLLPVLAHEMRYWSFIRTSSSDDAINTILHQTISIFNDLRDNFSVHLWILFEHNIAIDNYDSSIVKEIVNWQYTTCVQTLLFTKRNTIVVVFFIYSSVRIFLLSLSLIIVISTSSLFTPFSIDDSTKFDYSRKYLNELLRRCSKHLNEKKRISVNNSIHMPKRDRTFLACDIIIAETSLGLHKIIHGQR